MKFGVQHAVGDPAWVPQILAPSAVARFARATEESGFDAIGFTDHPSPSMKWVRAGGEGSADPFSALGFCAALTETIRLLTWVLVLPYRNPLLVAHQVATLDALSAGRVTLGVGTGYLRAESYAMGADPGDRLRAFDDALDVMTRALSGEELSADGAGFSARQVRVQPPATQLPRPPVWIHGNSRWGLERAARSAQGWIGVMTSDALAVTARTAPIPDLGVLRRKVADLRDLVDANGRRPEDVEVIVTATWPMLDIRGDWEPDVWRDDVEAFRTLGADWIVVTVCGDDPAAAEDTVRRFGEDVVGPASSLHG
jgi:probable F420-dependent oxidoreductase